MKKTLYAISALLLALCIYYFYPEKKLSKGAKIDAIVVHKAKRKLEVYQQGKKLAEYTISLGGNPVGDKEIEGDLKTPEGVYRVINKQALGVSRFHRSLDLNYPTAEDRKQGKTGGGILIHGLDKDHSYFGKFQRWKDWTKGCIALTDDEIDEIYAATPNGTKVTIYP